MIQVFTFALLLLVSSSSFGMKRVDVPGYFFEQLTDNRERDLDPRVSPNGKIVWVAGRHLPGAQSADSTDLEVFLWDGNSIQQVTDNNVEDSRCVVNDFGDVAWQSFGSGSASEIFVRVDGSVIQVTGDVPGVMDRYPDLNNHGVVVWGRRVAVRWSLAVFDAVSGAGFDVVGDGYRPHISALDHIIATGEGLVDTAGSLIQPIPAAQSLGYAAYRRREVNDLDQLALEADPGVSLSADFSGPRDILFWDGVEMQVIYSSPGPWVGRADLNAAGVVAFEGDGGLLGSLSGPEDREIFVYDPEIGTVIQLTDDDTVDVWPTVTGDGRVVWWGAGGYPGAMSASWDREIFIATPNLDADGDGVPNTTDNCPLEPNLEQDDRGGFGTPVADGRGDACQCGDVSGDGEVGGDDLLALRQYLAGVLPVLAGPRKCGLVDESADCSLVDWVVLQRVLLGSPPASSQECPASLPWL